MLCLLSFCRRGHPRGARQWQGRRLCQARGGFWRARVCRGLAWLRPRLHLRIGQQPHIVVLGTLRQFAQAAIVNAAGADIMCCALCRLFMNTALNAAG